MIAGIRSTQSEYRQLQSLQEQFPEQVQIIVLDVTSEQSIVQAKQKLLESDRSIQSIINNAGILIGRERKLTDLDLEEIEKVFAVNTFAPLLVLKHFISLLRGKKTFDH